jgi:hypothetical protein
VYVTQPFGRQPLISVATMLLKVANLPSASLEGDASEASNKLQLVQYAELNVNALCDENRIASWNPPVEPRIIGAVVAGAFVVVELGVLVMRGVVVVVGVVTGVVTAHGLVVGVPFTQIVPCVGTLWPEYLVHPAPTDWPLASVAPKPTASFTVTTVASLLNNAPNLTRALKCDRSSS